MFIADAASPKQVAVGLLGMAPPSGHEVAARSSRARARASGSC